MQLKHIRQLPGDVIGQIAAGEVVERPAAAIKELVENSMDAGATAITVEIRDGGITFFRVVDNGSGIQPSDIRLAFSRHATSKIAQADDLYGVQTLGFRGEALASIAAVARVTCVTRLHGAEYGVSVQNNGSEMGEIKEAACPEGTGFTVKDLFFNAPVRRKFLKKPVTETGYISDLMMRFILSHPQISFRYIADGKTVYFSAGDSRLESAVMSIYGLNTLEKLHKVSGNQNGVLLEGYVGVGDLARGNRAHQSFILNGRLIKSALLTAALEEACKQRVMIGRFPVCILHLTMPFEAVDVNVHPNKWEVRFQDESAVREAVQTLILNTLRQDSPLSAAPALFDTPAPPASTAVVTATAPEKFRQQHDAAAAFIPAPAAAKPLTARSDTQPPMLRQEFPQEAFIKNSFSAEAPAPAPKAAEPPAPQAEQTLTPELQETFDTLPVRLIGVVFNTYILLECQDRLLLCDQHAVHERLLYEQFMRDSAGHAATQLLMVPELIRLTHREYDMFLEAKDALYQAGFDVSDFGDLTVQLRSVPMMLGQARSIDCFRDALDDLIENGVISTQKRTDRIIQMACKHAVKGGERAPMEALMDLVRRMIRENVTPTCPHGRPLIIEVTQRELEKRFHRIQN